MGVNTLSFNQLATALNAIYKQATGKTAMATQTTADFVSVAQATLRTGVDPVMSAISQVVGKTVFDIRPYNRRFKGLQVTNQQYGAITRKLFIGDKDFVEDDRIKLTNGSAIDQQVVNMPDVLQMNFYGQNVFEKYVTIFRDQLDTAFRGPEEFGEFLSMVTTNASDQIEQAHETVARSTIANLIGGKVAASNGVIHLLTEYNTLTGQSLTATTVYLPANYPAFMKFVYSRIAEISSLMEERSNLYQINVTGHDIYTHTPQAKQKVYLYAPARYKMEASVLADTYHDNYLRFADTETVNFWQSIQTPDSIKIIPTYLAADGSLTTPENATTTDDIFGVIFDEDAAGYTVVNQWTANSPFNARGGYSNIFWHFTDRYWNSFLNKAVVLLLD